ncbi:MAG: ATP-binding protein [Patulibacter minatonensis]
MSWRCPYGKCPGTGFVYDEERNVATDCECRPQMLAAARAAKLRGRIPDRYRNVDFDLPPVTDMPRSVVRIVERYVNDLDANLKAGRGLWFQGTPGTGKTTLAMLVSKRALAAGRSVAVYSVPRLLAELRDTFDDDAELSATQLIDRLTAVELLHLDDLGAERTSPWVLEQLYSLINARYEAERAVLVTTNLERDQLIDQIGARSVSRLTEMCGEIPLNGEDHRSALSGPPVPQSPAIGERGGVSSGPTVPSSLPVQPGSAAPTFEASRIAEMREIGTPRERHAGTTATTHHADAHDWRTAGPAEPAPWRPPAPAANLARPDWPTPGEPVDPAPAAQSDPPSWWDRRDPWPGSGE